MKKLCYGFGHRDLYCDISGINNVIHELVMIKGVDTFLTGGMGDFDSAFSAAVRKVKTKNPSVRLWLIKPYFSNEINTNREYYEYSYDEVIIPDQLAQVHFKSAIAQRNKWMIDQCDYVISGIYRDFGGAYTAIQYAEKKNKIIIEIIKNKPVFR